MTSPVTLGIVVAYVVGKPVGLVGASWLVTVLAPRPGPAAGRAGPRCRRRHDRRHRVHRLAARRDARASQGDELQEAKFGVLAAAVLATALTWCVFWLTAKLPVAAPAAGPARRRRAAGRPRPCRWTPSATTSAAGPTPPSPSSSTATSSAPTAGRPSPSSASCSRATARLRYVWRHLPLERVHPQAALAAEAAEAAAAQGAFWEMHDLLLDHQDAAAAGRPAALRPRAGARHATGSARTCASTGSRGRVAEDVESADDQRRLGHADVLRQRPPALRRLRHRHAAEGRDHRPGPRQDHHLELLTPAGVSRRAGGSAHAAAPRSPRRGRGRGRARPARCVRPTIARSTSTSRVRWGSWSSSPWIVPVSPASAGTTPDGGVWDQTMPTAQGADRLLHGRGHVGVDHRLDRPRARPARRRGPAGSAAVICAARSSAAA